MAAGTTGTILVASAFQLAQLVVGRIILGVGVGFATQATPLFLSEMAPYNLRGALNILFQLAVTIGIFAAQLINYGTQVRCCIKCCWLCIYVSSNGTQALGSYAIVASSAPQYYGRLVSVVSHACTTIWHWLALPGSAAGACLLLTLHLA